MHGDLLYRPPRGGGQWLIRTVELIDSQIRIHQCQDSATSDDEVEVVELDPSCSVFETNLGSHAFELVTPKKILHFISESHEATVAWIDSVKSVIQTCELNLNDPFIRAMSERIGLDIYYEVIFRENKPLGVVLERSNECAIVKISNFKDSGIEAGSVLIAINDIDVTSLPYRETISHLQQWKPPLRLRFRKAPSKFGFLKKYTKDKTREDLRVWKNRYFSLEAGHLQYRDADTSTTKGDIPLMGSSVSILAGSDIGDLCCFRILSGVTGIILQAEGEEIMMDWVTSLYHAIAIANGGSYLRQLQNVREANQTDNIYQDTLRKLADANSLKEITHTHTSSASSPIFNESDCSMIQLEVPSDEPTASDMLVSIGEDQPISSIAQCDSLTDPSSPSDEQQRLIDEILERYLIKS